MAYLNNVNEIEVKKYCKTCKGGMICDFPDIDVLSMDGDNLTCRMGGIVQQTITKANALLYINFQGGFK